jgi:putative ABC transport system ATP-binding protein
MVEPIIEVNNLSVIYNKGKSNEVRSLIDVSVKIYPQEYVIMYGPSGCGKSTLMYSMSGLQLPTSGSVNVNGKDIATMKKRELVELHQTGIGMIFQAFYLISSLNILENVCLPKVFRGEKRKIRKEDGMKLLQRFSLAEQADKFSNQLSGGQQQRVSIARSLINDPSIILADEPVGNLDSESSENVLKILKDLNEIDKKTIVMVTHNPEHLIYADRILHMKDGKIVSEEINKDKRPKEIIQADIKETPEEISDEIKLLMRTFKNFSPQQVGAMLVPFKSKQLISHILAELTEEQITSAERSLTNLLFKNNTIAEFNKSLDLDFDNGGAGWNKLRADRFSERVKNILQQVEHLGDSDADFAVKAVADYMFELFKIDLEEKIKLRAYSFLKLRIENKIDSAGLKQRLDAPIKLGGAGLYKPTVDKIAREVEMLMLLKFSA